MGIKKEKQNIFARRLETALLFYNVTQQELANYVGVTRQAIGKYKDGITTPDIYTFKKIVKFFKSKNYRLSYEFWLD